MIAYIAGKLVNKKATEAVLEANGVGYRLLIPASSYEALPDVGQPARLLTYFQVREDAQTLYGFASDAERDVFETMIGVSGVGPKLALAALSAMRPDELRDSIVNGDASVLQRIPGVGRKTAERLVVELRDKLPGLALDAGSPLSGGSPEKEAARADALSALQALGFARAAAEKKLRKVLRAHPNVHAADELIRLALRES